jgi:hypothetical protein
MPLAYPDCVYRLLELIESRYSTSYNDIPPDLRGAREIALGDNLLSEHVNPLLAQAYPNAMQFPDYWHVINPAYRLTKDGRYALAWRRAGLEQGGTGGGEGAGAGRTGDRGETGQGHGNGAGRAGDLGGAEEGGKDDGDRGAPAEEERTTGTSETDLPPSRQKAYSQYQWAIRTNAELSGAGDRAVYDWLTEHSEEGEQLPSFASWTRYLRDARAAIGTSKHTPRHGRETGRSIVRPSDI